MFHCEPVLTGIFTISGYAIANWIVDVLKPGLYFTIPIRDAFGSISAR